MKKLALIVSLCLALTLAGLLTVRVSLGRLRGGRKPSSPACAELIRRFMATRAKAPGTCRDDAGCATYAGGLVDCGSVTDRASATALNAIAAEYRNRGCQPTRQCAPRALKPGCQSGLCVIRRP